MEGEEPYLFWGHWVKGQGHHYYKYNVLPFDNLYRQAYFVMHTFLVQLSQVAFNEMMMMSTLY